MGSEGRRRIPALLTGAVVALLLATEHSESRGCAAAADPPGSSARGAASDTAWSARFSKAIRDLDAQQQLGRFAVVDSAAVALLSEAERRSGPDSPEAAQALSAIVRARMLGGKQRSPGLREMAERALRIAEHAFGPESVEFAAQLELLGMLTHRITPGDSLAVRLLERSLSITEKSLGPDHLETAIRLTNLGIALSYRGSHAEALARQERALRIRERALGPDDPLVAQSVNNIANVLIYRAELAAAESLYRRALTIREKSLGPDHPDVAASLNNLANVLNQRFQFQEAHEMLKRSVALGEKTLGPDHPEVGRRYYNLARTSMNLRLYQEARTYFERSLAIREKSLGPDHPDVGVTLRHLGTLATNPADAKRLYERALTIADKNFGEQSQDYALALGNIAVMEAQLGDTSQARIHYEKEIAILESKMGREHPFVATALTNLAVLRHIQGDLAGARKMQERALAIMEKAYGTDHPVIVPWHSAIARLSYEMGDPPAAFRSLSRAETIRREDLRLMIQTRTEQEALALSGRRDADMDLLLSWSRGGENRTGEAWDAWVRSRALVLDEMAIRNRTLAYAADPELSRLSAALTATRTRLANLTMRRTDQTVDSRYPAMVQAARVERRDAERALAERSARFRHEHASRQIGAAEIARSLPAGSALVSFAQCDLAPAAGTGPAGRENESVTSYLAFVLTPGASEPRLLDLGRASRLDSLVQVWRDRASGSGLDLHHPSPLAEAACRRAGQALRQALWDPLAPLVGDARRVFVVPDGSLHLVNIAALPADSTRYLVETGPLISYLSAERDLVSDSTASGDNDRDRSILAVGGVAFDDASVFAAGKPSRRPADTSALHPFRGPRSACDRFREFRFQPLPGTAAEVRAIAALWKRAGTAGGTGTSHSGRAGSVSVLLTGVSATEASVKARAPACGTLHLATHGFFLGEECRSPIGALLVASASQEVEARPDSVGAENPLLLTGLALSGANRRELARPYDEDGILTAEEIAALDLSGVRLAVLSACETGLGTVRAGEGVLGLQRAFQVAGVATVVMSLWAVEDESTRDWMQALYEARLLRVAGTADAVRQASMSVLASRRSRGLSTHPFFWGAFVAAGSGD